MTAKCATRRRTGWAVCVAGVVTLAGCSLPGSPRGLTVRGQLQTETGGGSPVALRGDFDTAYYRHADDNTVTFVLLDGPEAEPEQAAVIRLFWRPRAGRTPLEETATNCTITYLVFAEDPDPAADPRDPGQIGVYSGAGFLHPDGKPGPATLSADMWEAALTLETRSDRFVDLLGDASLTGSFRAERDPGKVNALLAELNRRVYERLGFPRLVRVESNVADKLADPA